MATLSINAPNPSLGPFPTIVKLLFSDRLSTLKVT